MHIEPDAPFVQGFFDPSTSTITHVLYDREGGHCAVIDPVLDYDSKSGRTSTASADRVIDFVTSHGLQVSHLLESHSHADHLSAAPYLKRKLGGVIAIGEGIRQVQGAFATLFNLDPSRNDGSQFDHLFQPDEEFKVGDLSVRALHVPGHTAADMAYLVQAGPDGVPLAFVGDTLFMPDIGSARCDFPGGDAHALYRSVQRLLALPPETRLFMCHDYPPAGRGPMWETTVREQRAKNVHLRDGVDEETFVAMREKRDATLAVPALMLPAIQVNIMAGALPEAEENGVRYLKIPLDAF